MVVSQDGYVSFRGAQRRDFGTIESPSPLVFVDIDSDEPEVLRRIPATFAGQYDGVLLVRARRMGGPSDDFLAKLCALMKRMPLGLRVCVLQQPVDAPARIEALDGNAVEGEADYLARARAVEIEALLEFGHAIWRPANYHYRLITGEHAGAYVKLGDAIREPRDADLIASWLHARIGPNVGLVLDTGTLTPVAQSLRLAVAATGEGEMGPVAVLDHHPRTGGDIDAALDAASGDHGRVVIVVSISSSGSLVERVKGALQRKGSSLQGGRVEILVDKLQHPAADESLAIWTPLPGQKPLVEVGARDDIGCLLCRDPKRAVVIPINPFSFDAMLPTQLKQIVPDTTDPLANRPFWEAAKRTRAIAVEREAHAAIRRHRSDRLPMGIKLSMDRAIADTGLREALITRVERVQCHENLSSNADLVLVAEHELDDAFADFWSVVHPTIAPRVPEALPFPPNGDFSAELCKRVREASDILIFALGAVTGGSLQRALVGIQDARKGLPRFELHALVVHARPASAREWQTVENSYRHTGTMPHLHFAWKSLLPDRSPLREEGALLRKLDLSESSDLDETERAFVEERLQLCHREIRQDDEVTAGGEGESAVRVLWGTVGRRIDLRPTRCTVKNSTPSRRTSPWVRRWPRHWRGQKPPCQS
jgi:hypothetical protein